MYMPDEIFTSNLTYVGALIISRRAHQMVKSNCSKTTSTNIFIQKEIFNGATYSITIFSFPIVAHPQP